MSLVLWRKEGLILKNNHEMEESRTQKMGDELMNVKINEKVNLDKSGSIGSRFSRGGRILMILTLPAILISILSFVTFSAARCRFDKEALLCKSGGGKEDDPNTEEVTFESAGDDLLNVKDCSACAAVNPVWLHTGMPRQFNN